MEKVALKHICEIGNGFAFKSKEYLEDGIPLLRISNIKNERVHFNGNPVYVDQKFLRTKADFLVEKGDVVIALSGATTGKYGIYDLDSPCLLNQRLAIIKAQSSKELDSRYFYYYLGILRREVLRMAGGAAQPNISTKELGNFEIPLPSLKTQQKIAAILDEADKLRRLNKKLIKKYEKLSQSLFLEMFGDPVSNPKGWEIKTLKEVLKRKSQNGHYATKEDYDSSGVKMIHMSDAFKGIARTKNAKKVLLDDRNKEKYLLESSDLLIARRSLNYEGAAKPCLIPDISEPLIYESSLIRISPDTEKINTKYVYHFFENERARKKYIFKHVTRSTISGINNQGLNLIEIIIPPISLQNQFANLLDVIGKQKAQAKQSLEHSDELFNSLLQRAFKGELV